jgi:hypothetical protein
LGLFRAGQNSIMSALEYGTGRQRYAQFEPVSDHSLEHCPFLRANGRAAGRSPESIDRALPRLLATGLRIDLSSGLFSNRRPGFNAGLFCDVT